MIKPCFKYPGGKRAVVPRVRELFQRAVDLEGNPLEVCEPFGGSGIVSLNLAVERGCTGIVLSDINPLVAQLHRDIRDISFSFQSRAMRCHLDWTEESYYERRKSVNRRDSTRVSVEFWLLLKQCFNGLCRFNRRGEFNSPWGKYPAPSEETREAWCERIRLHALALREKPSTIKHASWEEIVRVSSRFDRRRFLYLDPPYLETFSGYSATTWTEKHSNELLGSLAHEPFFVLSYSDHPLIREYADRNDWAIEEVEERTSIGPGKNQRRKRADLLVYPRELEGSTWNA